MASEAFKGSFHDPEPQDEGQPAQSPQESDNHPEQIGVALDRAGPGLECGLNAASGKGTNEKSEANLVESPLIDQYARHRD
jgi:hypothetical protein